MGGLPRFLDPRLLVGMETSDDAGIYLLADDLAIINTVDYFTPIVDDPFTFGAIAVTNGLSDVYSMGGVPRTALNIVLWDKTLPPWVLNEILRGGAETLHRAGCALVGGHSVEATELMYGVAVTGTVHPQRFVRNCDAVVGDVLILTKPLGVGILATAAKYDEIRDDQLQPAIDSMLALNDAAAEVMREYGARASTDITGFGLLGHAHEVAKGSGVAIEIHAEHAPILDHVLTLIAQDTRTRASRTNREFLGDYLAFDAGVSVEWQQALLEAETSGGLLLAFPPERADAALVALRSRGCSHAAIVGRVVEGRAGALRVMP